MEESSERKEIDRLIAAFFSAFDNRAADPTLGTILRCFTEKGVIARSGSADTQIYTAMEFARPRIDLLLGGTLVDFHEVEESATTDIFGKIAIRTSRYRKSGLLNGSAYVGAGTKLFQLVLLDSGWRILSLVWSDDET